MSLDERTVDPAFSTASVDVDHVDGPDGAADVLLMYGDYECPYTRAANVAVRALQQRQARAGTPTFRYVFRHFPLREIHPHAQAAAEAVGLDVARFDHELEGCVHAARVQRDVQRALADGARGTPTLLVDGAPYHGERTSAALAAVLAG